MKIWKIFENLKNIWKFEKYLKFWKIFENWKNIWNPPGSTSCWFDKSVFWRQRVAGLGEHHCHYCQYQLLLSLLIIIVIIYNKSYYSYFDTLVSITNVSKSPRKSISCTLVPSLGVEASINKYIFFYLILAKSMFSAHLDVEARINKYHRFFSFFYSILTRSMFSAHPTLSKPPQGAANPFHPLLQVSRGDAQFPEIEISRD